MGDKDDNISIIETRKSKPLKNIKFAFEVNEMAPQPVLTCTTRGLRTVRTGYAYQRPACRHDRRRRAACPRAPGTVHARLAYRPRAYRMYRVPWHLRPELADVAHMPLQRPTRLLRAAPWARERAAAAWMPKQSLWCRALVLALKVADVVT